MIKANNTGQLETLLKETLKQIEDQFRIQVIEYGVGPITESDVALAEKVGATILAFDVPIQLMAEG